MGIMVMDKDGDHHALEPGGTNERFDFAFAGVEAVFVTLLSEKDKAFEIAEAIVDDGHDFSGVFATVFVRMNDLLRRNAVGIGENGGGVAAESIDASTEI